MMLIEAGGVECKKSHQKAAHRKTIPFEAGFYAVSIKSQSAVFLPSLLAGEGKAVPLALYKSGASKYERLRLSGWRGAGPPRAP
ncbi:hypothetical protein LB561_04930 [Mesorhizobium sp. B292B1B]|uniref:hypothetical protein n=1 Tax=unclassified Mesorhizobium TaxID=325217 RepID=UPI0015E45B93|nr:MULTISPECIES: hypothetical protein [unclassified Mesorhizobium]MCA0015245.1 hypothetical protein [Mesorhizobium sp. B294B1A1]MCA0036631.1 hypothetical protein [Mesorhizobium sp. B292B1B]